MRPDNANLNQPSLTTEQVVTPADTRQPARTQRRRAFAGIAALTAAMFLVSGVPGATAAQAPVATGAAISSTAISSSAAKTVVAAPATTSASSSTVVAAAAKTAAGSRVVKTATSKAKKAKKKSWAAKVRAVRAYKAKVKRLAKSNPRAAARTMMRMRGYSTAQQNCVIKLWNRESNWRWNAANPSSSAYGIPQALPGSKMRSHGRDWRTNPVTQIKWGLSYIKGRYGKPCNAWNHSQRRGWY
ncbi:lytic transglycosylase domain-containing protein [Nocardioides yefusunii]|uniref:Lytic transglycosylase domain-containing protein n=1 Tax=Nocardioides yefusunii TaxID=2500546 RepID=A0ABW1QUX9_9ACTN|nr:lytic transglycosylase domain-containing protein [Nocardioides yefusunii]